jgi:type II secretory pathway component GspD/PulD (secretin)
MTKNGETAFIGGLIQDTKTKIRSSLPGLGDIPGLNVLFGKTSDAVGKSELIVLITSHILDIDPKQKDPVAMEKIKKVDAVFGPHPLPGFKRLSEFMKPID